MKNQRIFPGIILLGFGIFFYLQQSQITLFQGFDTWPTILLIVGIAFLFQGYMAKDHEAILPGVILAGFGLHFHVIERFSIWPNSIGAFILIIALGFLLRYQKVGDGLIQGILFLVLSIVLLFYDKITGWLGLIENGTAAVWEFWPIILVVFGGYLLFIKKK
ncbi:DUF5668 domain-containing protein [Bacillaceae bacterium CLA-AA-H227]|uniref:DUF5668 domain-containing protein n=1 Tax=Robertmurraya yapensis (ex Hitch et al 2024) TaxID=3133160 RepID=A0ACC6SA21_9BACI